MVLLLVLGLMCLAWHRLGLEPRQVYHATVMPCYDKKLEASRRDFAHTATTAPSTEAAASSGSSSGGSGSSSSRSAADEPTAATTTTTTMTTTVAAPAPVLEVDLVLTTVEVLDMLTTMQGDDDDDEDVAGATAAMMAVATLPGQLGGKASWAGPVLVHGGSGGYAEYIFRCAARELFGVHLGPVTYVEGKNKDWKELVLEVGGKVSG